MGEEETNHTQTGLVIFLVAMTKYPNGSYFGEEEIALVARFRRLQSA